MPRRPDDRARASRFSAHGDIIERLSMLEDRGSRIGSGVAVACSVLAGCSVELPPIRQRGAWLVDREPDEIAVEGRVGDPQRVLSRRVAGAGAGGRLEAPLANFVTGLGQRFNTAREHISRVEVRATDAAGKPVALDWDEKTGPPLVQEGSNRGQAEIRIRSRLPVLLGEAGRGRQPAARHPPQRAAVGRSSRSSTTRSASSPNRPRAARRCSRSRSPTRRAAATRCRNGSKRRSAGARGTRSRSPRGTSTSTDNLDPGFGDLVIWIRICDAGSLDSQSRSPNHDNHQFPSGSSDHVRRFAVVERLAILVRPPELRVLPPQRDRSARPTIGSGGAARPAARAPPSTRSDPRAASRSRPAGPADRRPCSRSRAR